MRVSLTILIPNVAFDQGEPLRDRTEASNKDGDLRQRAVRHGTGLQHAGAQTRQADHSPTGGRPHENITR